MSLVQMTLYGGAFILFIVVVRALALHRLPKGAFLALWEMAALRLLLPFTIPLPLSVFAPAKNLLKVGGYLTAGGGTALGTPPAGMPNSTPAQTGTAPGAVLPMVWLAVAALTAAYFTVSYVRARGRFRASVPDDSPAVRRWLAAQRLHRPLEVRQSALVSSPLTYGVLRPVILLPEDMEREDDDTLTYILTHELVHVRRFDAVAKLVFAAALCVHWFNPLVWALYVLANRDLELACDEAVVHILGLDSRKGYACALLSAAESGFSPLCITYATKNHMEERIRAIMKMKKRSAVAVIAAVLLVTGITAVFATSPKPPEPQIMENLPQAVIPDPKPDQADKNDLPGRAAVPGEASFIWPLPQEYQKISFPFTERVVHPATGKITDHPGIDVAAPKGTPVCAAKSGVVTRSERDTTYGNLVELSHSDGSATLYAHLSERAVEVGQAVKQGEAIGTVGATGSATGPVLHFGIFADGSPVDPAEQLKAADAPTEAPGSPPAVILTTMS